MVKIVHLTSQHQSLVKAEVTPLQEDLSVSNCGKVHQGNVCPARRSVCYGCNKRGHFKTMCCSSRKTSQSRPSTQTQQPKVVQEVETHDQNTGKTKNVNIVEMIRSMGLHAKNPQNANVQEMSIVHDISKNDENPVFYTPVHAQICNNNLGELSRNHGTRSLCSYTS